MGVFKDRHDRQWSVEVTVGAIERVRRLTGVNLYRAMDDGMALLGELTEDPGRRVAVLYALCAPQVEKRGLSLEEFGESFSGDSVDSSWHAFLDSLADFFPSARHRQDLKRLLAQCRALRGSALDLLSRTANEAMDEVDRLTASTWSGSAGSSAASPGSTPGPSP